MDRDSYASLHERLLGLIGATTDPAVAEQLRSLAGDFERLASLEEKEDSIDVRIRRRAALVELSAAPTSSEREALEHVARWAAIGLDADMSLVLELLRDGDLLVRAGYGWPPGVVGRARDLRARGSQAGYTVETGEPVAVEDLTRETRFAVPDTITAGGAVASATALIPGKGGPYGVLQVNQKRPRSFSDADMRFMTIVANMAGNMLAFIRAERASKLQHAVASALHGSPSVRAAAEQFLRHICEHLDFQAAGIWRPERDGSGLRLRAQCLRDTIARYPGGEGILPLHGNLLATVWETGQPVWSMDMSENPAFQRRQELKELGLAAGICFPVPGREGPLAIMELFKDEPYEPDTDMLSLLETLSRQIGLFIARIRAERSLREREQEIRALVEKSPDSIGRYDRNLTRIYANPTLERVAGMVPEDRQGSHAEEGHPHRLDAWKEAAQRAFETGQEQVAEIRLTEPNGEERILHTRIVPEVGPGGSVEHIISIGRDVTDFKRAEEEARSRYEQLRALVEAAPIGMVIADARTKTVILANREYERIVARSRQPGSSLDEPPRRAVARGPDGSALPDEEMPLRRALEEGEFVQAAEMLLEHPDGNVIPIIATSAPVLDSRGQVVAAIAVVQDITPLKQLDRLRSDFLAMVGHELRTPLSIIRLAVGSLLAEEGPLPEEDVREALTTVDEQAARLASMISSLRDTAQIEAGAFSVAKVPGDFREVLEQAVEDMRKTGVDTIQLRVPDVLPPVPMDRMRILQVLENLLTNAAMYGRKNAPIILEVEVAPRAITVHVRNYGPGIPKERQAMLFQKFSRLERRRGKSGSGLGLVIAKGIVEAHGGRIWVESSRDAPMTTFSFTIPTEPVRRRGPHTVTSARPSATPAGRVLVVDDEPDALRFLEKSLQQAGYEAITTSNPEAVADIVEREHPDVVLLDVVLPGVSGFDLYERLRAHGAQVIFISGRRVTADAQLARDLGAADFLMKPVSAADLVASVDAVMRGRQSGSDAAPLTG